MACDRALEPLEPLSLPYTTPTGEIVKQPLSPGRSLTTRFRTPPTKGVTTVRPTTAGGPCLLPGGWRAMRHTGSKPRKEGYDPAVVWAQGGGHSPGCV